MRTYERTHPWLKFSVDLSRAPAELWILLGECKSKCEHIAGVPLRPATARELHEVFLVKGSLASVAIEGNTLSEQQVMEHRQGRADVPPSKEYLQHEVDNVIEACNNIAESVAANTLPDLTPARIKQLNEFVLGGLELEKGIVPGKVREWDIFVGNYKGPPSGDCDYLLTRLCEWLESDVFRPDKPDYVGVYSILKALLAHLYVAWIHPFGDGNGRTARLLEFQILLSSGIPGPAAHLLSNHYNQTRTRYYLELNRASGSGGDVIQFLLYSVQGFLDGLKSQLDLIRNQQWDVTWRNYVHEIFKDKNSPAHVRQRHLILDLSRRDAPMPVSELRYLSKRVMRSYEGKTDKTLSRDIRALIDLNLLKRGKNDVSANKEIILSFLPIVVGSRPDKH